VLNRTERNHGDLERYDGRAAEFCSAKSELKGIGCRGVRDKREEGSVLEADGEGGVGAVLRGAHEQPRV